MAKTSKSIVDKINSHIREKSSLIKWRNTKEVKQWFDDIKETDRMSFIKFDIVSFYLNISRNTLMKAIVFARSFVDVTPEDVDIIIHSC